MNQTYPISSNHFKRILECHMDPKLSLFSFLSMFFSQLMSYFYGEWYVLLSKYFVLILSLHILHLNIFVISLYTFEIIEVPTFVFIVVQAWKYFSYSLVLNLLYISSHALDFVSFTCYFFCLKIFIIFHIRVLLSNFLTMSYLLNGFLF